ncbi:hypothetical protein [Halpernia sp.]|uniref:hypothetical protein n=1 Tax=Halpernia sp. TaxID=2782209 RepID=UPI003A8E2644
MKNTVVITAILGLSLMACKKENTANTKNVTSNINSLKMDESKSFTYLATNSERANLSFQNEGNDHRITIKANNMKYVLDKKDADSASMVFERNGVVAKLTKDSLIITQDDKVIPLVRTN